MLPVITQIVMIPTGANALSQRYQHNLKLTLKELRNRRTELTKELKNKASQKANVLNLRVKVILKFKNYLVRGITKPLARLP